MTGIRIDAEVRLEALGGLPRIHEGDDLCVILVGAIREMGRRILDGDVLVVASKLVSRAEGRSVDLSQVQPGDERSEQGFDGNTQGDGEVIHNLAQDDCVV